MVTDRSELELGNGERLPWLETAEDYDARQRRGWGTVLAVLGGLLALLLVIGGIWYTQRDRTLEGDGALIAAPAEPYKERADGSDGMQVGNESDAMLAASQGEETRGRIAAPPPAPPVAAPSMAAMPDGTVGQAPPSAPAQAASSAAVQLGAFADNASAQTQWTKLSRERPELSALNHSIEQVQAGGKTVFRLRAAVPDMKAAQALCGRLQAAGTGCFAVR